MKDASRKERPSPLRSCSWSLAEFSLSSLAALALRGATYDHSHVRDREGEPGRSVHEAEHSKAQLPDFQRGWVWDDAHVRALLASSSLSYPIGTVMLLRAGGEILRFKQRPIEGATPPGSERAERPRRRCGMKRISAHPKKPHPLLLVGARSACLAVRQPWRLGSRSGVSGSRYLTVPVSRFCRSGQRESRLRLARR